MLFPLKKKTFLNLGLPVITIVVTVAIGLLIYYIKLGKFPSEANFLHLDAAWYKSIVDHGYEYNPTSTNNTAFFPFYPYVWRWVHLGSIGISILNGSLFVLSTFILLSQFDTGVRVKMLYCVLSLLVFYVIPYSESLFCFFGVVMLMGLKRDNTLQTSLGILGAGLTRSVSVIFVPTFLLIAFYKWYSTKQFRQAKTYFGYAAVSIISTIIVFSIQWYQTGVFFAFIKTQEYWNNKWQSFGIPFSSWGPEDNKLSDQLALFVCLLCIVSSVITIVRLLRNRDNSSVDSSSLFGRFYFAGVGLLMLFTKGGEVNSINRYVFATPFLFILLADIEKLTLKRNQIIGVTFLGIAYYLICWHMGINLTRIIQASILLSGTLLILWTLRKKNSLSSIVFSVLIVVCLFIQAALWFRYVIDQWVG